MVVWSHEWTLVGVGASMYHQRTFYYYYHYYCGSAHLLSPLPLEVHKKEKVELLSFFQLTTVHRQLSSRQRSKKSTTSQADGNV